MSAPVSDTADDAVFAPVRSQTAFEETVDRLGTAIKLGLLAPGTQLPPERELCAMLGIARSTLRQALIALGHSGHLVAVRGRGGGTFVAERPPPPDRPTDTLIAQWREVCDERLAVEVGVCVLAVERADAAALSALSELVEVMAAHLDDFPTYRQADVRFHVGLAEATGNQRLVTTVTEAQSLMGDLISNIAHPPSVLESSNAQHAKLLRAIGRGDVAAAVDVMRDHLHGTEHVLAGLLPG